MSKKKKNDSNEEYYPILKETKIIQKLYSFLEEADNPMKESEAIRKAIRVMDTSQIMMIEAISNKAKLILRRFVETGSKSYSTPKFNGYKHKNKGLARSVYPMAYLKDILSFFNKCGTSHLVIHMGTNTPSIFEDNNWKIYLAPRISEEDHVEYGSSFEKEN